MELITLTEFKAHARIVDDSEDAAIQLKVDAANEHVSSFLDIDPELPAYAPPAEVKQAALLIACHWWEHREDTIDGALADIPIDAGEILLNYRGWCF